MILRFKDSKILAGKLDQEERIMEDQYGSDFMTIVDEDGTEFEPY